MEEKKKLTPMRAIRAKCLDCCCMNPNEVRLCPSEGCPLYAFRDGHNPNRKGIGNKHIGETRLFAKNVSE